MRNPSTKKLRARKTVKVNDKFQKGYKYELTEPVGQNFHPDFKSELTPKQMLALGVFGGSHAWTALGGIIIGFLILYLPDKDLKEIEKL